MPRTTWRADPTFYPSPSLAAAGPREGLAYVATFWRDRGPARHDALAVVDVDVASDQYGRVVGWTEMPELGDELHHHGWNACSSALCPSNPHPHIERRYLLLVGLRSSRIHFVDVKDDPRNPRVTKVIDPDDYQKGTGYSRPHTVHCGPQGIYISNLGAAFSDDGPGGIALLDHDTFEVKGKWEVDRGDQYLTYDFWWHINKDVLVASEWGTPAMIEDGVVAEKLLGQEYGHRLHFFDLRTRKLTQTVDLGAQHQMVLELRPAHDPTQEYGFAGVVVSTEDLSASVWLWHREGDRFAATRVITVPAEPVPDPAVLPELFRPFGVVPPLVTDIDLSVDDRFLYVSCFGTGEAKQYDVSDPFHPVETGSIRLGGIADRAAHPSDPGTPLGGAPQMVEISRDGRRVYWTNSLYSAWDEQFYSDGVGAWMVKADVDTADGGMTLDQRFFPHGEDFRGNRVHQIRLAGGDSSSDSYCFP